MQGESEKQKLSGEALKNVFRHSVRLFNILWKDNKGVIILLGMATALFAVVPFLQVWAYGFVIDGVVESSLIKSVSSGLILAFSLYIIFQISFAIITPFQGYFTRLLFSRANKAVDILSLGAIAKADFALRDDPTKMSLFNNANENWWKAREFVLRQYFLLQNIVEVAFASAIVLVFDPIVFLILFVGTLPELIVESKYGAEVWGIFSAKAEIRRKYWATRFQFEQKSFLFDIKLFQNIGYFLNVISDLSDRFIAEEKKVEKRKLNKFIGANFLGQVAVLSAYAWFIYQAVQGNISVGVLVFVLGSIYTFRTSLSSFFRNLGSQFQDSLFVGDLLKLVDMKPVVPKPVDGEVLSSAVTPEIFFDNVTFKYPGTDAVILKDFTLKIKPGDKIALIGVNGAGKTTFVKLLLRFYDPTEGRILINGRDLKTIDLESWYENIGVLFQDYANFNLLVKEVVALGRTEEGATKDADIEKVKASAHAAEADIFIEEWDKKYEKQLGSWLGGIEPSIGQWQKLALARTFYRDPRILILDEPTSSIDAEAEAKIFEKLESLPSDRTVILISHRFSTVRKANQIVIIEDGAIKELGTHEDLIKLSGTYARLFNIQAKGYK